MNLFPFPFPFPMPCLSCNNNKVRVFGNFVGVVKSFGCHVLLCQDAHSWRLRHGCVYVVDSCCLWWRLVSLPPSVVLASHCYLKLFMFLLLISSFRMLNQNQSLAEWKRKPWPTYERLVGSLNRQELNIKSMNISGIYLRMLDSIRFDYLWAIVWG